VNLDQGLTARKRVNVALYLYVYYFVQSQQEGYLTQRSRVSISLGQMV